MLLKNGVGTVSPKKLHTESGCSRGMFAPPILFRNLSAKWS